VIALVRVRPGYVGETKRVTHAALIGHVGTFAEWMSTLMIETVCGDELRKGTFDVLAAVSGMPCEACLAAAATGALERPAVKVTRFSISGP
jgi:hypothetical protein